MPFEIVPDPHPGWFFQSQPCKHPQHYPPSHMIWPRGRAYWICPGCGNRMLVGGIEVTC